ncbi:MAG: 30S ribosomal protein S2 [Thermoplasmata archaeon]|nr:30S ribosomal protein S2 [Thermoplasmata archaeon]
MLVERTDYLSAGVHIGMKSCTKYLKQFVYKIRDDGLAVFNLRMVDARIVTAAAFLSRFENMLIISRKTNAAEAINKFAEVVGCKCISGRFSPGTLTNPSYRDFCEPDVVVLIDPLVDEQAVREAKKKRIPVVTFCDTFNEAADMDLIIPTNNNGKKAIALILMLLAKEILKKKGKIKKDSDFKYTITDFGADITPLGEGPPQKANQETQPMRGRMRGPPYGKRVRA